MIRHHISFFTPLFAVDAAAGELGFACVVVAGSDAIKGYRVDCYLNPCEEIQISGPVGAAIVYKNSSVLFT